MMATCLVVEAVGKLPNDLRRESVDKLGRLRAKRERESLMSGDKYGKDIGQVTVLAYLTNIPGQS